MIIAPVPVHHHDAPILQTAAAPIHLFLIPFQDAGENIKYGGPHRIDQPAGLRDTVIRYLQVETIKTETVLVQALHGDIRLPRAAMESFPHPQQLYATV